MNVTVELLQNSEQVSLHMTAKVSRCSGCKLEVNSRLQVRHQQMSYPRSVSLSVVSQNGCM